MVERIIWDWNGTLLNDLDICIQSINTMFKKRGMPVFDSHEAYFKHFKFPIKEYYQEVGFDFEKEPYPLLAKEFMDLYDEKLPTCPLFPLAEAALKAFDEANVKQMILSAAERSAIVENLKSRNIDGYFECILGLDNVYAKGKVEIAREWIDSTNADMTKTVMLGDTLHDSEIADLLGCDCILIRGGHSSEGQLQASGRMVANDVLDAVNFLLR